ncbi:MAG: ribosome biogenesis GTP-binding protein YihA/YsxC [Gammaproteobacteria bacterium]
MSDNPYRQAEYILSAHEFSHFPPDSGREVAFVGRSNVGKSSVINTITDQKNLARTSKTPGRTQQINFFHVEDGIRLVDLPGYGFAKVALSMKQQWFTLINRYLTNRQSLAGLVIIVDIRREISAEDRQMLEWCVTMGVAVHVLINKADKLAFGKRKQALHRFQQELAGSPASFQLYSATAKTGTDEVREVLGLWLFPEKSRPRH